MLKPKVVGCAAKRRVRSVDLPLPEGPERIIRGVVGVVEKRRRRGKWRGGMVVVGGERVRREVPLRIVFLAPCSWRARKYACG